MDLDMPQAVSMFFSISNRGDLSLVPVAFQADARVKDESREHVGTERIREWLIRSQAQYDYRAEPVSARQAGQTVTVVARLEGNFPGSPVALKHVFELCDGKISALEIG